VVPRRLADLKPTGHVQEGLGRVRMRVVPKANAEHLCSFVTDVCERGSVIYTDGHSGYLRLPLLGYEHDASVHSDVDDPDWVAMRSVHRIASLLKRWLLGTHQGSVAGDHLDYYLDEFTFRFNRRRSRSRGLLFYRLMQLAVQTKTIEYNTIVWSRRTNETKRRGVPRGTPPVRRRRRPSVPS
jgi:transposase-like protein